jgi:hypothetical protein
MASGLVRGGLAQTGKKGGRAHGFQKLTRGDQQQVGTRVRPRGGGWGPSRVQLQQGAGELTGGAAGPRVGFIHCCPRGEA